MLQCCIDINSSHEQKLTGSVPNFPSQPSTTRTHHQSAQSVEGESQLRRSEICFFSLTDKRIRIICYNWFQKKKETQKCCWKVEYIQWANNSEKVSILIIWWAKREDWRRAWRGGWGWPSAAAFSAWTRGPGCWEESCCSSLLVSTVHLSTIVVRKTLFWVCNRWGPASLWGYK